MGKHDFDLTIVVWSTTGSRHAPPLTSVGGGDIQVLDVDVDVG